MKGDRPKRTKELTNAVRDLIHLYGGYCWRNNNQPRIIKGKAVYPDKAAIGTPDLIAMMPNGVTLWIEIKISPDGLRESQHRFMVEAKKRGHPYLVVKDTTDGLVDYIRTQKRFMVLVQVPKRSQAVR